MKISEEYAEPIARVIEKRQIISMTENWKPAVTAQPVFTGIQLEVKERFFRNPFDEGPLNRMRDCRRAYPNGIGIRWMAPRLTLAE